MSSISLSMIVKNEEKYLAGCLESVKDIVDEIVVVDTGSEDQTVKIAQNYGAHVYSYTWNNDFSAARNFALSKSNSDWILYLDADERLDTNSRDTIKKLTSSKDKAAVRCKIYSIDEINKKPKLQSSTRLFKKSDGIEFRGKAHEQIDESLMEKGYKLINSDLLINHLGYNLNKNELRKKAERNLALLIEDYKTNSSGYCAFQIANSYSILGDKDGAFKYYNLAVVDPILPPEYKSLSYSNIAEYYLQSNEIGYAVEAITNALRIDPINIISNLTASEIYFRVNKPTEAVNFCIKAFEENQKGPKTNNTRLLDIFIEPERIIYHGLNIAYSTNHPSGIEYFFNKLEDTKSGNNQLWQKELNLIQFLSMNSPLSIDEIDHTTEVIDNNNLDFYFGLLKNYNDYNIKLSIGEKLITKFHDNIKVRNRYAYDLTKAGRKEEAIRIFEDTLSIFPEDPSPVFYLLSLYLEKKEMSKLENLITSSKKNYSNNKVFQKYLLEIESKINSYKLNIN